MLAPVTGKERYLTLGTGHCTALCKAANAGCRTPISYIQDRAGKINLPFLKMQKQYKQMLEVGLVFLQLPWQVEDAWPTSPDVLQRALNANNEVNSSVTELEVAVTIAECLESGEEEEVAIAVACSGNPLCAPYAEVLAELAKKYGGGQKVPLLHKLDSFAKKFGENRRLGEEFLHAVVHGFKYPDPADQLPRVVDMLLTCNMVAPKVVDGIARCLTKTDVNAMCGKAKLAKMKAVEQHLEYAEELADYVKAHHPTNHGDVGFIDEVDNKEGLFKVRMAAYLAKKGNATFEAVTYSSMDEIVQLSLKDLYELIEGSGLTQLPIKPVWAQILASTRKGADEQPEVAAAKGSKLLSTNELKSKEAAADRAGYKLGVKVYERTVGAKEGRL